MPPSVLAPPASLIESPADSHVEPVRRVVLVDPRLERRAIVSRLVDRCPSLTVVGLAGDLGEAETQIRSEHADVALVEVQMPLADSLATIRALRGQFPEIRILVCSFHGDSTVREEARTSGADGYLLKPFRTEDLLTLALPVA